MASSSRSHIKFDGSETLPLPQNLSQRSEPGRKRARPDQSTSSSESDSDDGPELLSTATSKRKVLEKESAVKRVKEASALAKKEANRRRDQKLKKSASARKNKVAIEESSASSLSETEGVEKTVASLVRPNQKKYLDPELFASASQALAQSRKASQARELQSKAAFAKAKSKRKRLREPQDRREIGNNTTVTLLSQPDHVAPSLRPASASNFARNRLYTKPNKLAVILPKATLAAKSALGSRRSPLSTSAQKRSKKPALVFTQPGI